MKKIFIPIVLLLVVLSGCSKEETLNLSVSGFTDEMGVTYQILPVESETDMDIVSVNILNGSEELVTINEFDFKLEDQNNVRYEPINTESIHEIKPSESTQFLLYYEIPEDLTLTPVYDVIESNVIFN